MKKNAQATSKKFPREAGITERCRKCGRERGEHDGLQCPKASYGDLRSDFDASGKLITEFTLVLLICLFLLFFMRC